MKFINPLDEVFSAPLNVKALRVLAHSELDLTGRQIAELAHVHSASCQRALDRLYNLDILSVRRVARANLYRLREDNLLVKEMIKPLFEKEKSLLTDELEQIAGNLGGIARSIILFGSTSRGEEDFKSDLDLCIIIDESIPKELAEEKVNEQISYLSYSTGITPSFLILTKKEFRKRYAHGDPLVRSVFEEGKAFFGAPLESLLTENG